MSKGRKTGGRDFKPGQSGNPKGRTPLPPEVREFRKLTLAELQGYISEVRSLTARQVLSRAKWKNIPALKAWIYSVAAQGILTGDEKRFDALMDRVVGRVADQVNLKATIVKEIQAKTEAELVAEAEALIQAVRSGKK